MNRKRTAGFWFLMIAGILLFFMHIFGQTRSFINYDFTVRIGLQVPEEIVSEMGAAVNKGFVVWDTIVYLPFLILA